MKQFRLLYKVLIFTTYKIGRFSYFHCHVLWVERNEKKKSIVITIIKYYTQFDCSWKFKTILYSLLQVVCLKYSGHTCLTFVVGVLGQGVFLPENTFHN